MRSILGLPLLLALLANKAVGKAASAPSSTQCLTSSVSREASWKACCGSGQTGGTADLDGISFDYTCNTFLSPSKEFDGGNFDSAYKCAAECAKSNDCEAAFWAEGYNACFYTTDSPTQSISRKSFLMFQNKRPTPNRQPGGPTDCQDLVGQAQTGCQDSERKICDTRVADKEGLLRGQFDKHIADLGEQHREQCNKRIADQEQQLMGQCDQKWFKRCSDDKEELRKKLEQDQAAQDEAHRRVLQKLQDRIDQLQKRDGAGNGGKDDQGGSKPSSSAGSPGLQVPKQKQWKCPDQDGKQYTVLGVTYQVFCHSHPTGRAIEGGKMVSEKDPGFLMALCSVDHNCQGIRAQSNYADLVGDWESPPKKTIKYRDWWSIIPVSPKPTQSAMAPDLFSRPADGTAARCPALDGQVLAVGENQFQVNCRNMYGVRYPYQAPMVKDFRQCLVLCLSLQGCHGVGFSSYGCSLIYEPIALDAKSPKSMFSSSSYLAMLRV
ncbi:uncharacterized protein N7498_004454 [Penicillium cinerascens]|uniref:Apple domain-containing protein n=1 Tax=Penicillium cinerascens TaxID=70096 RepID=A0A9W9T7U9_9EURO|nr:uncharacterized protein N7498_004454 [Penicillium cinerascens]KAJ5212808.1 hypothetical protein N7498_004454 [Penicillium cinerascens]